MIKILQGEKDGPVADAAAAHRYGVRTSAPRASPRGVGHACCVRLRSLCCRPGCDFPKSRGRTPARAGSGREDRRPVSHEGGGRRRGSGLDAIPLGAIPLRAIPRAPGLIRPHSGSARHAGFGLQGHVALGGWLRPQASGPAAAPSHLPGTLRPLGASPRRAPHWLVCPDLYLASARSAPNPPHAAAAGVRSPVLRPRLCKPPSFTPFQFPGLVCQRLRTLTAFPGLRIIEKLDKLLRTEP